MCIRDSYIPIYKFTVFKKNNFLYKGAEEYYANTLSLPIYFNLSLESQKKIIDIINSYLKLRLANFKV